MKFKIQALGPELSAPIALYFEVPSIEEACTGGFRILGQMPECEHVEINGHGYVVVMSLANSPISDGVASGAERMSARA